MSEICAWLMLLICAVPYLAEYNNHAQAHVQPPCTHLQKITKTYMQPRTYKQACTREGFLPAFVWLSSTHDLLVEAGDGVGGVLLVFVFVCSTSWLRQQRRRCTIQKLQKNSPTRHLALWLMRDLGTSLFQRFS
mgnify:CR=1 FL=1